MENWDREEQNAHSTDVNMDPILPGICQNYYLAIAFINHDLHIMSAHWCLLIQCVHFSLFKGVIESPLLSLRQYFIGLY